MFRSVFRISRRAYEGFLEDFQEDVEMSFYVVPVVRVNC